MAFIGNYDFDYIFLYDHTAAALSCQPRIAVATVGWVAAATGSFRAYATGHRLIGWILVPLGVGALAGLLRRGGKALDKAP